MKPGFDGGRKRQVHLCTGVFLCLALTVACCLAAEAAAGPPTDPAATTTSIPPVYLEYRELGTAFVNFSLPVTPQLVPFQKEPDFSGRRITRGTLTFGNTAQAAIGLAWDYTQGKLYLDLNRNQDLTDDPTGRLDCLKPFTRRFQTFTNVQITLSTPAGLQPARYDLNLYNPGRSTMALAGLRSFWQGKLVLDRQEWQFGMAENVGQQVGAVDGGYLLLRPWELRDQPFSLQDGSLDGFSYSRNVFVNQRAYRITCTSDATGARLRYKAEFAEQQPRLGELRLHGERVDRLVLHGAGHTVVLDRPGPIVRVPVGSYDQWQVMLGSNQFKACRDDLSLGQPIRSTTVVEGSSVDLAVGGPLTNSVTVSRRGQLLVLNYSLLGADGSSRFRLLNQDRSRPPQFTIRRGGKELFSGQFEFG